MIDHLEVLLEERSMELLLTELLPKIVPGVSFDLHAFRGKPDLLKSLQSRLRGYKSYIPSTTGIVVVVDRDNDDCRKLKQQMEELSSAAGLVTRSVAEAAGGNFQVINRIAVEELEAWFFGDVPALHKAYPRVPLSLASRAKFRDSDAISGGTAEALERVLSKAGYHQGGLAKTSAASDIARWMNVEDNRSTSFIHFRDGLRRLVAQEEV